MHDQKIINEPQIALSDKDYFREVNPVCPRYGSIKYVKDGFRERNPKLGDFGEITVYVQRYECKGCSKRFPARIDGIVKKWRQYAEIANQKVNAIVAIVKYSGIKIQQVLLTLFGVTLPLRQIECKTC